MTKREILSKNRSFSSNRLFQNVTDTGLQMETNSLNMKQNKNKQKRYRNKIAKSN